MNKLPAMPPLFKEGDMLVNRISGVVAYIVSVHEGMYVLNSGAYTISWYSEPVYTHSVYRKASKLDKAIR